MSHYYHWKLLQSGTSREWANQALDYQMALKLFEKEANVLLEISEESADYVLEQYVMPKNLQLDHCIQSWHVKKKQ